MAVPAPSPDDPDGCTVTVALDKLRHSWGGEALAQAQAVVVAETLEILRGLAPDGGVLAHLTLVLRVLGAPGKSASELVGLLQPIHNELLDPQSTVDPVVRARAYTALLLGGSECHLNAVEAMDLAFGLYRGCTDFPDDLLRHMARPAALLARKACEERNAGLTGQALARQLATLCGKLVDALLERAEGLPLEVGASCLLPVVEEFGSPMGPVPLLDHLATRPHPGIDVAQAETQVARLMAFLVRQAFNQAGDEPGPAHKRPLRELTAWLHTRVADDPRRHRALVSGFFTGLPRSCLQAYAMYFMRGAALEKAYACSHLAELAALLGFEFRQRLSWGERAGLPERLAHHPSLAHLSPQRHMLLVEGIRVGMTHEPDGPEGLSPRGDGKAAHGATNARASAPGRLTDAQCHAALGRAARQLASPAPQDAPALEHEVSRLLRQHALPGSAAAGTAAALLGRQLASPQVLAARRAFQALVRAGLAAGLPHDLVLAQVSAAVKGMAPAARAARLRMAMRAAGQPLSASGSASASASASDRKDDDGNSAPRASMPDRIRRPAGAATR